MQSSVRLGLAVAGLCMVAATSLAAKGKPDVASVPPLPTKKAAQATLETIKREKTPAKQLFGAEKVAALMKPEAVGFYSRGCLAGGEQLPVDGVAWQAMRLSRNRNWGHPDLVALLKRFASDVQSKDGWHGLLVGDIAQPRGGPMLTGHASHQVGLDADIWFTPMPERTLTRKEREQISATTMLAPGGLVVDRTRWTESHAKIIKRVSSYREVQRIFVHPALKKALCEDAGKLGEDRSWLSKVRPYWGHHYHFHVRIHCPTGSTGCKPQPEVAAGDGCGAEVDHWIKLLSRPAPPKPVKPEKPVVKKPAKPKPEVTLASLPPACRFVLDAAAKSPVSDIPIPGRKPAETKAK